jgi:hypothetical protein
MADVYREVVVKFSVDDSTSAPLKALEGSLGGVGTILEKTTALLSPLTSAFGQLAAHLNANSLIEANSKFEDLQVGLAQTIKFMGAGGDTFAQAMAGADQQMRRLVADSSSLPGNMYDYASALKIAGASVQRATGDYEKSYDLIKQTTAVAISLGGSAQMGAQILTRALDTQHGMLRNAGELNIKLLNSMRQLPGLASLTTKEFNTFSLDKRTDIFTRAMAQFKDMTAQSANSWTTIKGTAEAVSSLLLKDATTPLFDGLKHGVAWINSALLDSHGNWTRTGQIIVNIGQAISTFIVGGVKAAVKGASLLVDAFNQLSASPLFAKFLQGADRIVSAVAHQPKEALGMAAGGVAGAGIASFLGNTNAVSATLESLGNGFSTLTLILDPMLNLFGILGDLVGGLVSNIIPPLAYVFEQAAFAITPFINGVAIVTSDLFTRLSPVFNILFSAVGSVIYGIGSVLGPALSILGSGFLWLYSNVSGYIIPIITSLGNAISAVIRFIGDILKKFGSVLGDVAKDLELKVGGPTAAAMGETASHGKLTDFLDSMKKLGELPKEAGVAGIRKGAVMDMAPEARGGGGRTVQDFRYSKFEIEQKFAEGFDPDRIAIAFAQDVGKLGEQKLQSGFAPTFALR